MTITDPRFTIPDIVKQGNSETAVRKAIKQGELKAVKVNGRWMVTPADYRKWRAKVI
jgi:formylmethanofuran:tetrahydromethanopterin formyltransferase